MSLEFAYRFTEDAAPAILRDLDVVALSAPALRDDGEPILSGAEGTIVSVLGEGTAYVVEFDTVRGGLATVPGNLLKLVWRAGV